MASQIGLALERLQVPDTDGGVSAGGEHDLVRLAETDLGDDIRVSFEGELALEGLGVPDLDGVVVAAGNDMGSAFGPTDRRNAV
jgi:hypothetical protein